jgi:membrane-bound metal-dependent hydrolase YbcI (DUF457 family)
MIPTTMPSPIGHALGGVAVAWIADLLPGRPAGRLRLTLTCAGLAVLPDADLLLPIAHRTFTHSIGAVAIITIIAAAVTRKVTQGKWRIALTCGAAYASHVLLDWLQADPTPPYGLQALWPISSTWFISGWNIFRPTERQDFFEWVVMRSNLLAVIQELALLVPVVVALWRVRVKALTGFATELSRGDHPT